MTNCPSSTTKKRYNFFLPNNICLPSSLQLSIVPLIPPPLSGHYVRSVRLCNNAAIRTVVFLLCWLPYIISSYILGYCRVGHCETEVNFGMLQSSLTATVIVAFLNSVGFVKSKQCTVGQN